MVTDQHWATGEQTEHSTLSDRIRERRPEQNGLQFSAEDGKRGRVYNFTTGVPIYQNCPFPTRLKPKNCNDRKRIVLDIVNNSER